MQPAGDLVGAAGVVQLEESIEHLGPRRRADGEAHALTRLVEAGTLESGTSSTAARSGSRSVPRTNPSGSFSNGTRTRCSGADKRGERVQEAITVSLTKNVPSLPKTRREIAAMLDCFEPPAPLDVEIVDLPGRPTKLIVIEARPRGEARPFTFDKRAYQRVQTTTSVMPQERYEALLLERAHARRRWENQSAVDVRLGDLDHEETTRWFGRFWKPVSWR